MSSTLCPLSETVMNASGTWSLSDRQNTTTIDSPNALDFTTQYQSAVVYEKALQDLYNNSFSELKDLQFKARERAPYNTNLCTLKPMYPTWNAKQPCFPPACDLNMHPTCLGGTACNTPNTLFAGQYMQAPLCPNLPPDPYGGQPLDSDSDCSTDDDSHRDDMEILIVNQPSEPESKKVKPTKRMSRNMMRALMGVAYDLNHWSDLPPQKNRLSTTETLKYVAGRDNRPLYIVMLIAFFVFIIAVMVGITCLAKKTHRKHKRKQVLKELKENAYLQYQLQQLSTPPVYYGGPRVPNAPVAPIAPIAPNLMAGGVRKW